MIKNKTNEKYMGMRMKKISIKYRILLIIIMIQIPFLILFQIYIGYTTGNINLQMAKGYSEALMVYCSSVESQLSAANAFLGTDCWGNPQYHQIAEANSKEEVTEQLEAMIEKAQILLDNNVDISCVSYHFDKSDLDYILYSSYASYSEEERNKMHKMSEELRRDSSIINTGWYFYENAGNTYMVRSFQYQGGYSTVFFDLQRLTTKSQTYYKMSTPVVFLKDGELITQAHWTRHYDGNLLERDPKKGYQMLISGGNEYIVVSEQIMTMTALYGVRYNYNWDWINIVIYLFVAISILSFMLAWLSLHISFFKPLKRLLAVMNSIKTGDLTARARGSKDREFSIINETFNGMLDTMENLKIETYENQLHARKSEMNALRLQIRRHFFLNCLKNIYAMARSGEVTDIQKAVLLLSGHLRYTLDISINAVDLRVELDMCRNYMELQGVGQDRKPRITINLDEYARDFRIPPISILTLVENCCKYGMTQDKALEVVIDASLRSYEGEKFMNIVILDNGPGFHEKMLQHLNSDAETLVADGHVGIANVMARIKMMYGDECIMIFANAEGASIDLIIPIKEDEHEAVNSR